MQTDVLPELKQIYGDLLIRWKYFRALYGDENSSRVRAITEKISPRFFGMLFHLLYENVVLSMARITDPAQTGRNSNLSLKTAIAEIGTITQADKDSLQMRINEIDRLATDLRIIRNKRLGHNDVEALLEQKKFYEPKIIPNLKYLEFDTLVIKCGELISEISDIRGFGGVDYSEIIFGNDTPEAFIQKLQELL